MGIMTGDAGELPPSPLFRRIGLACDRVTGSITKSYGMNSLSGIFMAGQTDPVHRLMHLIGIFT